MSLRSFYRYYKDGQEYILSQAGKPFYSYPTGQAGNLAGLKYTCRRWYIAYLRLVSAGDHLEWEVQYPIYTLYFVGLLPPMLPGEWLPVPFILDYYTSWYTPVIINELGLIIPQELKEHSLDLRMMLVSDYHYAFNSLAVPYLSPCACLQGAKSLKGSSVSCPIPLSSLSSLCYILLDDTLRDGYFTTTDLEIPCNLPDPSPLIYVQSLQASPTFNVYLTTYYLIHTLPSILELLSDSCCTSYISLLWISDLTNIDLLKAARYYYGLLHVNRWDRTDLDLIEDPLTGLIIKFAYYYVIQESNLPSPSVADIPDPPYPYDISTCSPYIVSYCAKRLIDVNPTSKIPGLIGQLYIAKPWPELSYNQGKRQVVLQGPFDTESDASLYMLWNKESLLASAAVLCALYGLIIDYYWSSGRDLDISVLLLGLSYGWNRGRTGKYGKWYGDDTSRAGHLQVAIKTSNFDSLLQAIVLIKLYATWYGLVGSNTTITVSNGTRTAMNTYSVPGPTHTYTLLSTVRYITATGLFYLGGANSPTASNTNPLLSSLISSLPSAYSHLTSELEFD